MSAIILLRPIIQQQTGKRWVRTERKNEIMIADAQSLRDKIHVIRGQQVMPDFELAIEQARN